MTDTLKCDLCGYEWTPRTSKIPISCPGCKNYRWNIKKKLLQESNFRCVNCGSKEGLLIHHLRYGEDKLKDLIILCNKCHTQMHHYKDKNKFKKRNNELMEWKKKWKTKK